MISSMSVIRSAWNRAYTHYKHMSNPARSGSRETAYLDGLRGFAALMVYMLHTELTAHEERRGFIRYLRAYGSADDDRLFITLPFIRIFFVGGHLAVTIFFVLSGYVLSSRSLVSIRNNDGRLSQILASAVFRRWFRLFLPTIPITLLTASWYHATGVLPFSGFEVEPSWTAELAKWYDLFKSFTGILSPCVFPMFRYGGQMWTLYYELKGSFLVFASCLAFAYSSTRARITYYGLGIFYLCYIIDGVDYACFLAGMLLREVDLLSEAGELPRWMALSDAIASRIIPHVTLLFGLLIGGVPTDSGRMEDLQATPFWKVLSILHPAAAPDCRFFFLGVGATLIVFSTKRIPWLKRFFELPLLQYFGRVSFMLYMFHEIILGTMGERIFTALGFSRKDQEANMPRWVNLIPVPRWGPEGMELPFWLGQLLLFPLSVLVADLATSYLDDPCVEFASWLYKQTQPRSTEVDKALLGSYEID